MATFDATKEYAYIDLSGSLKKVEGDILVDKGVWNSGAFYDPGNVISYQTSLYVCLATVSIYPPSAIVDDNWSSLVDVSGGTPPPSVFILDGTHVIHSWHMDWGTNPGQINATQIPYPGGGVAYPTVEDALDSLFYVAPAVTSFTNNVGTVEVGSTVLSVAFNWSYNKTITSQSMDQGIGVMPSTQRALTASTSLTSTTTYHLTGSDGVNTATGASTVAFQQKRYWGTNSSTSLTDGQILSLNSEFATSRFQTRTISVFGQYIYFAYPASFGLATFSVNGLLNTAWTLISRTFINSSGFSETYNIYRSNNLLTGTYVIVIT